MKKVLVPVDFSEQSSNAFQFAIDLATKSAGEIKLLHVIPLPVLHDSRRMPVDAYRQPLIEELKRVAHHNFCQLILEHNGETLNISADVVINDHIHQTISEYAKKENIDVVVIGTKGASGMREWLIGSNAEKIVRSSHVPVIAIKKYTKGTSIRNIVFPNTLDTENQEDLVTKVKVLQTFFDAQLHILCINTPALAKADGEIRELLKAFVRRYMLKNYTINVFNYSDEEAGILEYTRQINGDLIAMGTRGLKGIAHLLSGSIAEDVVNHVQYPVWTYCTKAAFQTYHG